MKKVILNSVFLIISFAGAQQVFARSPVLKSVDVDCWDNTAAIYVRAFNMEGYSRPYVTLRSFRDGRSSTEYVSGWLGLDGTGTLSNSVATFRLFRDVRTGNLAISSSITGFPALSTSAWCYNLRVN